MKSSFSTLRKSFGLAVLLFLAAAMPASAQLNIQLHDDYGHAIYGKELSNRPEITATIENFTADKWGSTYFFKWLPTPVFLPEEFYGQRRLASYSSWGCKESDMTEQLTLSLSLPQ